MDIIQQEKNIIHQTNICSSINIYLPRVGLHWEFTGM